MPQIDRTIVIIVIIVIINIVHLGGGGGYSGFQVTGIIKWEQKSKPKIIPKAFNKTQKKTGAKINPPKIPCRISEP